MGHTWKNESYLKKWLTLAKNLTQLEKWSHLENCVTIRKMCDNWKNGSNMEKCVRIGKMGQTKNMLILKKWVTF